MSKGACRRGSPLRGAPPGCRWDRDSGPAVGSGHTVSIFWAVLDERLGDGVGEGLTLAVGEQDQARPDRADHAESGEQSGDPEGQHEGAVGGSADAELGDECVSGAAPGLLTGGAVEQVGAVEVGPVAAVDRNVVRTWLEDRALVRLDHAVVGAVGFEGARLDGGVDLVWRSG